MVGLLTEWKVGDKIETRSSDDNKGGTMRLGKYDCVLKAGSKIAEIYGSTKISERHRHRYEVNTKYIPGFAEHEVVFTGMSPDGELPEVMENKNHPWFVGVQFHPELKSRPFEPHPLFCSYIKAAVVYQENKAKL